jgi:hypothetical protein
MPLIELERSQLYSIYHDSDELWLYVDWTGHQTPASVQQGCNRVLELMVEQKLWHILNDNTHVEGIWIGAARWCAVDFFPRLKESGFQSLAWIYGSNPSSRISTDATLSFLDANSYNISVFEDAEEAKAWLRKNRMG